MSASNFSFSCFVNVSNDSLTETAWIVRHPIQQNFNTAGNGYAISAVVMLFFLLGLPWNLFVICAIIKKRLYSQPIIMLMLNLAITNLLLCILVMPFNIVSGIAGEYVFGESDLVRCRVCQTGILIIALVGVSVHTLCFMSIDRLIYLKKPLKYAVIVTPRRMLAAIIATWVLCITICIPPFVGFGQILFSYTVATCVPHVVGRTHIAPNYYYTLLLLAESTVPIITIFVVYIWMICIIRGNLLRKEKLVVGIYGNRKKYCKEQLRLVRFFVTVFSANLVTWLPMMILVLWGAIKGLGSVPVLAYSIPYLSFLSETVIHPVLEAFHIRAIKIVILKVLKCKSGPCKRERKLAGSSVATNPVNDVSANREEENANIVGNTT